LNINQLREKAKEFIENPLMMSLYLKKNDRSPLFREVMVTKYHVISCRTTGYVLWCLYGGSE